MLMHTKCVKLQVDSKPVSECLCRAPHARTNRHTGQQHNASSSQQDGRWRPQKCRVHRGSPIANLLLASHLQAICLQWFSGKVISWVQSLQPTLQLGLWAAVDNMWHRLAFATRAHVGCCNAPTSFNRMHSGLVYSKSDCKCPVSLGRSNLSCCIVGSSTSKELITWADFHSSRHWEIMSVG